MNLCQSVIFLSQQIAHFYVFSWSLESILLTQGWPCQGSSCLGLMRMAQPSRSGLLTNGWSLVELAHTKLSTAISSSSCCLISTEFPHWWWCVSIRAHNPPHHPSLSVCRSVISSSPVTSVRSVPKPCRLWRIFIPEKRPWVITPAVELKLSDSSVCESQGGFMLCVPVFFQVNRNL